MAIVGYQYFSRRHIMPWMMFIATLVGVGKYTMTTDWYSIDTLLVHNPHSPRRLLFMVATETTFSLID
jgi:hypothetical protein